jgi:hypothetical protein
MNAGSGGDFQEKLNRVRAFLDRTGRGALIIGRRTASTDMKTSLNQALREFDIAV